jgi:hypothetical protein
MDGMRIASILLALLLGGALGCGDTNAPDDDDDSTFPGDDDDATGDDDDATGDDDDATGDDDDATGDDDDATGDDDDATTPLPPYLFTSHTSGGEVLTSPGYSLELYVAPAEPIGSPSSSGYQLQLGPGAVRAAR